MQNKERLQSVGVAIKWSRCNLIEQTWLLHSELRLNSDLQATEGAGVHCLNHVTLSHSEDDLLELIFPSLFLFA